MRKCFICNCDLKLGNNRHMYCCAKQNGLKDSREVIRYKQICFNSQFDFTSDYMVDKYSTCMLGLQFFKKEHGLSFRETVFLLDYFGISRRSLSEASNLDSTRSKYQKTCVDKYGVDNVSKSVAVKNKKKDTFTKNYGVDNIWKDPRYYEWLHAYMFDKYGAKSLPNRYGNYQKWWDKQSLEYRKKIGRVLKVGFAKWIANLSDDQRTEFYQKKANNIIGRTFNSRLEVRMAEVLQSLNVSYQWCYWIKMKSYDFRINNTKLILEVNGDFWHANPLIYKPEDILKHPEGDVVAKDIWLKDANKKELASQYGYIVIYIWESEMKSWSDEELKFELIDRLGIINYEAS